MSANHFRAQALERRYSPEYWEDPTNDAENDPSASPALTSRQVHILAAITNISPSAAGEGFVTVHPLGTRCNDVHLSKNTLQVP